MKRQNTNVILWEWVIFFLIPFSTTFANCDVDTIPPQIISCPEDIESCSQVVIWSNVVATDNCSSVTILSNYTSGSIFPIGTTTVTYVVRDKNRNESTCSFTVTVHPVPTADAGDDLYVCASGDPIQLGGNPTASGGTPGYTYSWYSSHPLVNPGNDPNPLVNVYTDSVNLFLMVLDANGCAATDYLTVVEYSSIYNGASVHAYEKINIDDLPFGTELGNHDEFGHSIAGVEYNTTTDKVKIIAGAPYDDEQAKDAGALYEMILDPVTKNIDSYSKIIDDTWPFLGEIRKGDLFGFSATMYDDINGDGYNEYLVGSPKRDDRVANQGAIWILFPDGNGGLLNYKEISESKGGFFGALDKNDRFGWSITTGYDYNLDGVNDIFVGTPFDDNGGTDQGGVWRFKMSTNGGVISWGKITETSANLGSVLDKSDHFGKAVHLLPDMNGNAVPELAVGAPGDDDGGSGRGAVYILFLNTSGAVDSLHKISALTDMQSPFPSEQLQYKDHFGSSIEDVGDINGDGIHDIIVGAVGDSEIANEAGSFWILTLNQDGSVNSKQKVRGTDETGIPFLDARDHFAQSVALIPSHPSSLNCYPNIMVGAPGDDGVSSSNSGAIYSIEFGEAIAFGNKTSSDNNIALTEYEKSIRMNAYPNPTNGVIHLDFMDLSTCNVSIEVFNMLGEKILSSNVENGCSSIELHIENHPKGMYIVRAQAGSQNVSKKIIVE